MASENIVLETKEEETPKKESDPIAARLKAMAPVIVAITGFVTAIAAYIKPTDHTANKASYELLAKDLKEVSQQVADDHDAILAMRGYMEGVLSRSGMITPITTSSAVIPRLTAPHKPAAIGKTPLKLTAAIASAVAEPQVVVSMAANMAPPEPMIASEPMPAPPQIGPAPRVIDPPSFDAVLKEAGK